MAQGCYATTYYIDFSGGSDSNTGTTKAAPWKRHPYMKGWTGTYTHSSGDSFVFKGGVTWDITCFTWVLTTGGANGNIDTYGVDKTWFTGGAWTRPKFSAGGVSVTDPTYGDLYIRINAAWITFDNFEFTGFFWNDSSTGGTLGYVDAGAMQNVTFTNSYAHGWSHGGTHDNAYAWTGYSGAGNPGNVLDTIECDGSDTTSDSMGCVYYFAPTVKNSKMHDMTNGMITGAVSLTIFGNQFYNINQSFDAGDHENCLETFDHDGSTDLIYNNIMHDCNAGVVVKLEPCVDTGGVTTGITAYFYNNLLYGSGASVPIPLQIDTCSGSTPVAATQALLYNNTIVTNSTQSCIRSVARVHPISQLTIENTHCITPNSLDSIDAGSVTTVTTVTNALMTPTTATSQGYVLANRYAPTSSTNSTVGDGTVVSCGGCTNIGQDILGVSRGVAWDIGAYQFNGIPVPSRAIMLAELAPWMIVF